MDASGYYGGTSTVKKALKADSCCKISIALKMEGRDLSLLTTVALEAQKPRTPYSNTMNLWQKR
jgi:hypothetical protein